MIPLLLAAAALPVVVTPKDHRIEVTVGGQPFTTYHMEGGSRPFLYPIRAADGTPLTRNFPMVDVPGEDHDHPWHKSFWFAHSSVNGVDFWNEGHGDAGKSPAQKGKVVTALVVATSSGDIGTIQVADNWIAPSGALICTDERTLRFQGDADSRTIDFAITIRASDKPLLFGDNKDGTMAIRLAQWMTMPHKYGKTRAGGQGHIVDANGDRDNDAWGKRADWCDYSARKSDGLVASAPPQVSAPGGAAAEKSDEAVASTGKTYGVAIFDDPRNLRHPTYWMARDYGLFGANPFGKHDYEKLQDPHAGDYQVPAGGTLTLRYRFYFHLGDAAAAHVADHYAAFAAAAAAGH